MGLFGRLLGGTPRPQRQFGSVGIGFEFAVLDVETTGLDPLKDRVIEVGVVVTDVSGRTLDEWGTLINPGVGIRSSASHINGIQTEWLAAAPSFAAVAHEVAQRMNGRIFVAHNVKFDSSFLHEEFARAGYLETGDWTNLCTLDLADKVGLPRRLTLACASMGIPHETHDALGDARATAQLFHRFMATIDPVTFAGVPPSTMGDLPLTGPAVACVQRVQAKDATRARPVLAALVASLPSTDDSDHRDPDAARSYLSTLEDAVADGYISPDEVEALGRVASRHGLSGEEARDLHRELILGMLDRALEDRRITTNERAEIERVAQWLDVDLSDWDAMVKAARRRVKEAVEAYRAEVRGLSIAFTGAGIHKANVREAFAAKYGFEYQSRVGSATNLVVIGTEGTETAQHAKARELGVPVVVESTFWRRLGEL